MIRKVAKLFCVAASLGVLAGCDADRAENCERLGYFPDNNNFEIDYNIRVPAKCPVPLASPGVEKKYAGATLDDNIPRDFDEAVVRVYNSAGELKADERERFQAQIDYEQPARSYWRARPKAEYVAATGTSQVTDHDVAEFSGWNNGARKAWANLKITYRQSSVSTKIAGDPIPAPGSTSTWNAPTTGGYPGYMYQWYRDGTPVGNGSSYTGTAGSTDFNLRVEVTDQTWSTVAAVFMVNPGGVEAAISGPALVYSSAGGGTWTATGRGGTGAYTFHWYIDDVAVGSGPSLTTYPGENARTIRVDMTDSAGAFDSHSFRVTGIGSGDGTCEPMFPAVTC
jgi:hypothetical protein